MNHPLRSRRKRRVGSRGAAMLEGIIVLTTMVVFMGLILWTRNSYVMKLDLQQKTRSNVLYYASHGCKGSGASSTVGGTVDDGNPEVEAVANKTNDADRGAVTKASRSSWNTASVSAKGTADAQAAWDLNATGAGGGGINLQKQRLTRTISASSTTTCNEEEQMVGYKKFLAKGIDSIIGGGKLRSPF